MEWRDMKTVAIAEYHLFTSHELLQRRHLIVPPPLPSLKLRGRPAAISTGFTGLRGLNKLSTVMRK